MMIAGAVALAAAVVVTGAGAREQVREIRLVARGMSFYLDGDSATANPTITLRRGERVRFVLRNETPGIIHDLAITTLEAAMAPVSVGNTGTLDVQVPEQAGRHQYECRPHVAMMKGIILVEAGR